MRLYQVGNSVEDRNNKNKFRTDQLSLVRVDIELSNPAIR